MFTAHYACSNADLNLTLVTGTTNGFIFQIIKSFKIQSCGVRLTCLDCKLSFRTHFRRDSVKRLQFETLISSLILTWYSTGRINELKLQIPF